VHKRLAIKVILAIRVVEPSLAKGLDLGPTKQKHRRSSSDEQKKSEIIYKAEKKKVRATARR